MVETRRVFLIARLSFLSGYNPGFATHTHLTGGWREHGSASIFPGGEGSALIGDPLGTDLWRIALAKRPLGSQKRPSLTRASGCALPVGTPRRTERVSRPATHQGADSRSNLGIVAALPRKPPPHQFKVLPGRTARPLDTRRERQHCRLETAFGRRDDARSGPRHPPLLSRACPSGLVRMRHRHGAITDRVLSRTRR
jgi:hypothetical protein